MNRTALRTALLSRWTLTSLTLSVVIVGSLFFTNTSVVALVTNALIYASLVVTVTSVEYQVAHGAHLRAEARREYIARLEADIAEWNARHPRRTIDS